MKSVNDRYAYAASTLAVVATLGAAFVNAQDRRGPPHEPGHRGGPPPAAFAACRDISAGDACLVDTPDGTLEGICAEVREGTVCIPNHMPHHDQFRDPS